MQLRRSVLQASLLLTGVVAWLPSGLTAQGQTGVVLGRITDTSTGQPIDGAQVVVVGTNRGVVSNREGAYRIPGVPEGEREVRAINIGYAQATQTITVQAGAAVTLDFTLQSSSSTQSWSTPRVRRP